MPQCYRHPGRETYIRCQRCDRPICPECMRDAAVGFQCPSCVSEGAKQTRSGLTPFGGRRSSNPQTTTIGLIAVNVAVWVAVVATGGASSWLAEKLMLTPVGRCISGEQGLWFPNATDSALCSQVPGATWHPGLSDGALWQVLTHGFTHVDIWHIALNALGLWILGPPIEQVLGRWRFLAVYLLSTLAAGATVFAFADEQSSTLGASGGVFGLMGALLLISWRVGGDMRGLLMLLALNAFITLTVPGISWQGHLGGFVGGALATAAIVLAPKGKKRSSWQWLGLGVLTLLVAVAFAARGLALA
ncbi:rhomboid family intramembrane serine protease [Nocardioides daphniae]|uniref:Rhomboid family intramembrane serine protease n=1 Tax=Nocardioides daphniae TaxID=402297 RepID=A0ABQ1Q4F9_9ACTN|nr:rhomboid family intramembrane serine protease [Nocardioides daphniae]